MNIGTRIGTDVPLAGERRRARAGSPYVILGMAMLAAIFDGYDGQVIGFLAPAIAKDWGLPKSEFGLIFSIGLVGLIIGAVALAPLGDRIGRRTVAITGTAVVAVFTLLTAAAQTPTQLALLRMATGIGLGTLMPILVTVAHEAAPPRWSGVFVTFLVTAFPFGSFLGAMLVAWGLEHGGWRDVFLVSGALACLFPLLFWAFLHPAPVPPRSREDGERRTSVASLFRRGWWLPTLLLWALFFASLLNTYMLGAWLPLLLERGGMPAVEAVRIAAGYNLGGTIGGVVMGLAAQRFGGGVLAIAYLIAAACLAAIGLHGGSVATVMVLVAIVGAMIPGGHVGNSVLAARLYPSVMNATGVGWAQGLGRVGCAVGPAAVGAAVAANLGNGSIFVGSATVAVLGAAAAIGLTAQIRARS
jgi:AAHS family 4-hydroxybenzoate transporter-like MFS transporter